MGEDRIRFLEEMFGSSPDALVVVGEAGVIELAGAATEPIFGYRPEELEGEQIEILLPETVRAIHRVHRATYAATPENRPMGIGLDLYGRHRDGHVFPVDVSLVPVISEGRRRFGAFIRDATERKRGEDVFRFVNDLSLAVITGEATGDLLSRTAGAARVLVGAAVAWISVRADDLMVVAAAAGEGTSSLKGASIPVATSLAARSMIGQETVDVPDMSGEPDVMVEARELALGPGIYLPMQAEGGPVGSLVLARAREAAPFDHAERRAAQVFASAAAIVLALGTARESLDRMRMAAEHERIARDLHDTVIQRLFGLGMRLQAAERLAEGPVAERIRATVDSIDEVIREIRETIFDLNRPEGADESSLRVRARDLVAEAAETLGFRPRLAFRGPVDAAASEDLSVQLLAVLREALSNVSRHAKASGTDVVIAVSDRNLTLTVADDGVGISGHPAAGHGLSNMEARADELGGECSVSTRHPSGTLVHWRVPLRR
ncbi:MAG TPA: PAS domain S-box protein [Acidimicrobiales bacterium]|nr:PAS domain S-box protein [Acidimicrobiales bacterium]